MIGIVARTEYDHNTGLILESLRCLFCGHEEPWLAGEGIQYMRDHLKEARHER